MTTSRVLMLTGVLLAVISSVFLAISAGVLVRVFLAIGGEPGNGLHEDLNVTLWASLGMGSGLICVLVGLAQAQGRCALGRVAMAAVIASALVLILGAVLVTTGMSGIRGDFQQIAQQQAPPHPDTLKAMVDLGTHRVSSGMVAVLNANIILAISVWQMFWARTDELKRSKFITPMLYAGLTSLAMYMGFQGAAVLAGKRAVALMANAEIAKPSDIAGELSSMLTSSK